MRFFIPFLPWFSVFPLLIEEILKGGTACYVPKEEGLWIISYNPAGKEKKKPLLH